ncbi:CppA N-terminal domain-containing protein [Streptococcus caprae]|uniref:CppA N-terminal domain-containing protein n=1 Tax=Streptococcus caprae TaxID=1640501 RepID=A0ABV8CWQ7_9STRE
MTVLENTTFTYPVLRVNNRDQNIAFYETILGFKCYYEENAIALFSGHTQTETRFVIEESPSMRTRAVEGPKKLNTLYIKAKDPKDIEALLASSESIVQVYRGTKAYAFEVLSPENDRIILHAENDLESLEVCVRPELVPVPDFQGLQDFEVSGLVLNVPDSTVATDFYDAIFSETLPVSIGFKEVIGPDLQLEPNVAWDLEILEFAVPKDQDMQALKTYFEDKGLSVYLDRKETVLVISDTSKIELWFKK